MESGLDGRGEIDDIVTSTGGHRSIKLPRFTSELIFFEMFDKCASDYLTRHVARTPTK
jgi:hypothetical protein